MVPLFCLLGISIPGFYLSIYAINDLEHPVGWDTVSYIWRTNCVAEGGLEHLFVCVPPSGRSLPSRVGYPLITLPIASLLSVSRVTFAAIFPAAAAATIGMAAGALGTSGTPRNVRIFPLVAAVVATSPMVVQMTFQYADTMIAMVFLLAGSTIVVRLVVDGKGYAAAAALLAAATIVHWPTALVLGAAIAIAVLPFVRNDWRTIRAGGSPTSTLTLRLGRALGGGALVWGGAVAGLVQAPIDTFHGDPAEFERKLRAILPAYGLPLSVPAAVVGARRLSLGSSHRSTSAILLRWLLGAWLCIIAAGLAAWFLGVRRFPPNRLLVLALPIPILGTFGLVWAAEVIRRYSRKVAIAAIALGSAGAFAVGYLVWLEIGVSTLHPRYLRDAYTVAQYLDRAIDAEDDVMIIVRGPPAMAARITENIRVALPPERIEHVLIEVRPSDRIGDVSSIGAPVLVLDSFWPSFDQLVELRPARLAAPNLLVLRGPVPDDELDVVKRPHIQVMFPLMVLLAVATILVLGGVGYGWTLAATGGSLELVERLALAPAFGQAAILLVGLITDRLGLSHTGLVGVLGVVLAGGAGYVLAGISRIRQSRRPR